MEELHILAVDDRLLLAGLTAAAGLHLHLGGRGERERSGGPEPGRLGRERRRRGGGGTETVETVSVATPGLAPVSSSLHVDPGQQVVLADDLEVISE